MRLHLDMTLAVGGTLKTSFYWQAESARRAVKLVSCYKTQIGRSRGGNQTKKSHLQTKKCKPCEMKIG